MPTSHTAGDQQGGTVTLVKEAEEPKAPQAPVVEAKPTQKWDDEDYVCFVRLNWGLASVPPTKVDFIDKYTCTGGIARNVRYGHAKKWIKDRTVLGEIFDNEVTIEEIALKMGRNPMEPGSIAEALKSMSAEKMLALLGPEEAKALARSILAAETAHAAQAGKP